ncbi:MAG: hypothetical protein R6T90_09880 [Dissulfuribacterales bacterium]
MPGVDQKLDRMCQAFPQQDPGPKQCGASPGVKPQQAVSLGPGSFELREPLKDELGDINFVRSSDPQDGHFISD